MSAVHSFKYSPEENMRRILMDKQTKYIVVEGEDDLPKYEQTIRVLVSHTSDFEPVFLGGRKNVQHLLSTNPNKNFIAITDSDFSKEAISTDSRLIILSRYSIENFIFCGNVLTPLIANIVSDTEANVRSWFCINDWINHLYIRLKFLLKALYFYQNSTFEKKPWSKKASININNSWKMCPDKIDDLLKTLYDNNVPVEEIENLNKFKSLNKLDLIKLFPGKLLITSLYSFIYEKMTIKFGNAKKLTTKVGNQDSLIYNCTPFLYRQHELRSELSPIGSFLD